MPDVGDDFGGEEARAQLVVDIGVRARQVGLYLQGAEFADGPEGIGSGMDGKVLLLAAFAIGDWAFATSAMDPERAAFDEQFRAMKVDHEDDDVEQIQAQRDLRGGLDEDDDG
jgi:hypothetical protein